MKYRQIRNATAHIYFAGKKFLIDPVLGKKEAYPGFENTLNSHLSWPRVELPIRIDEVLDCDAVIVTHTHPDHLDEVAIQALDKNKTIFVQNENDKEFLAYKGFNNIKILSENSYFKEIKLIITKGQHGSDELIKNYKEKLGVVSGVIFSHKNEKTTYLAGDTIWCKEVENTINKYQPEVIILNAGDAQLADGSSIIMGKEDTLKAHLTLPKATIIATHLEAVGHSAITRKELKEFIEKNNIEKSVLVPEDGETIEI